MERLEVIEHGSPGPAIEQRGGSRHVLVDTSPLHRELCGTVFTSRV
ncbi:hypothetical protein [Wenjunlia tyrosinilytica]|nr:hypothetical protein [Wenjunlia tyrosinilytica]